MSARPRTSAGPLIERLQPFGTPARPAATEQIVYSRQSARRRRVRRVLQLPASSRARRRSSRVILMAAPFAPWWISRWQFGQMPPIHRGWSGPRRTSGACGAVQGAGAVQPREGRCPATRLAGPRRPGEDIRPHVLAAFVRTTLGLLHVPFASLVRRLQRASTEEIKTARRASLALQRAVPVPCFERPGESDEGWRRTRACSGRGSAAERASGLAAPPVPTAAPLPPSTPARFSAIHSVSRSSAPAKVNRLPEPTRRRVVPSAGSNRQPSVRRNVDPSAFPLKW